MKENRTELVFILDRSGSMHGLEGDTIGGFNSMLAEQKDGKGEVFVSTVLFDHESAVLHDRVSIDAVAPLTRADYVTRGSTALYDALGGAIHHIGNIHKYARREDVPARTLFVIITDGMENASRLYSRARVREMIERQRTQYGWEFLFLGANIDAEDAAEEIGIPKEFAVEHISDSKGTQVNFGSISKVIGSVRRCEAVPADWADDIKADKARRMPGRKR